MIVGRYGLEGGEMRLGSGVDLADLGRLTGIGNIMGAQADILMQGKPLLSARSRRVRRWRKPTSARALPLPRYAGERVNVAWICSDNRLHAISCLWRSEILCVGRHADASA
jgi:hypothetical protein